VKPRCKLECRCWRHSMVARDNGEPIACERPSSRETGNRDSATFACSPPSISGTDSSLLEARSQVEVVAAKWRRIVCVAPA
jgi:hypothetical protein